jgi:hypothetical protein
VDRSGWCVVSCTIDDVPTLRQKRCGNGRMQTGQYTVLRKPMRKELGIHTEFDHYYERFRAYHSGNVVKTNGWECVWFNEASSLEIRSSIDLGFASSVGLHVCSKESSVAV